MITIFDKAYPTEDAREAVGILQAALRGDCDCCPYLKECETVKEFGFPQDAACVTFMKKMEDEPNEGE